VDGVALLAQARAAGLTVTTAEGKLIIRGPRRAEALAQALIRAKPAVLAALSAAEAPLGPALRRETMPPARVRRPARVLPFVRRDDRDDAAHPHCPSVADLGPCADCGGRRFWQSAALTGWHCEDCRVPVSVPAWRVTAPESGRAAT
jgi:hypothetical protein